MKVVIAVMALIFSACGDPGADMSGTFAVTLSPISSDCTDPPTVGGADTKVVWEIAVSKDDQSVEIDVKTDTTVADTALDGYTELSDTAVVSDDGWIVEKALESPTEDGCKALLDLYYDTTYDDDFEGFGGTADLNFTFICDGEIILVCTSSFDMDGDKKTD